MPVIAGVDSSTQSTKVVLRDADDGAVLGLGKAPHPPTYPPVSEQDPERWWDALIDALASAVDQAGVSARDIAAISIAAQCHGLVPLDANGTVIRRAKLWNDTSTSPQMQRLRELIPSEQWADRVGTVPTAAFTVSKLAWLADNEPANFARLSSVLLPHDWLTWKLTGRRVTDRSEASGTAYFNADDGKYDFEILSLIDPDRDWASMLPTVLRPAEPAGLVTVEAAERLGLRRDVVVGPGAGDQHASALGLGVGAGTLVYSLGTSGVVFTVSPNPVHDASGFIDGVADANGGYLPLVSTLNAAKVTDTVARLLGVDHDELSALALAAPARDDRAVMAAYLDGERSPDRPGARGTITGISTETTREELARAAYEGVVFGLYRGQLALEAAHIATAGPLIAVGGGAASPAYLQVLANTTSREVFTALAVQPVAMGAAVQAAAVAAGTGIDEIRDAWAPTLTSAAAPRSDTPSAAAYERYLQVADWRAGDSGDEGESSVGRTE